MRLTLFPRITSPLAASSDETYDWPTLTELFAHKYDPRVQEKSNIPSFFPGIFKPDEKVRNNKAVLYLFLGVLDFDGISSRDVEVLLDRLETDKVSTLIYTTWSNDVSVAERELFKLRLAMPFSRSVGAEEWDVVWRAMFDKYGNLPGGSVADIACKDVARAYYLPYLSKPLDQCENDFVYFEQRFDLNVDSLKYYAAANSTAPAVTLAPPPTLTPDSVLGPSILTDIIRDLSRSKNGVHSVVVKWCKALLAGKSLGFKPGERHNSWRILTKVLADRNLDVPPASIYSSCLRGAVTREAQECAEGSITSEEVISLLAGAQDKRREELAKQEEARLTEIATEREALSKKYGLTYYTEADVKEAEETLGLEAGQLKHYLVVQSGKSYYVYAKHGYQHFLKDSAVVGAHELLQFADESLGLYRYKQTEKGPQPLTLDELVSTYGTATYGVTYATHLEQDQFDLVDRKLKLPLFRHPRHEAQESPFISEWFRAICEDEELGKLRELERWVGWSIDLSIPLSLLLLVGKKGTGKSLFAQALATYWNRPCASAEHAFGQFSGEELFESPIILADEKFPADQTAKMRSMISMAQHRLNRKYHHIQTIEGHYRFVVAVNNENNLLGMKNDALNEADVDAISQRVFQVKVSLRAAKFLARAGRGRIEEMLKSFEFARHAEFLRRRHAFAMPQRFGTEQDEQILDKFTVAGGTPSALFRWITNYLLDQNKGNKLEGRIKVEAGQVYMTVRAFEQWDQYLPGEPRPRFDEINGAFDAITHAKRGRKPKDGVQTTYRVLNLRLYRSWLEMNDSYAPQEQIEKALGASLQSA